MSPPSSPAPPPSPAPSTAPSHAERARRRHVALHAVRAFFVERGFVEVDTPLLVPGPGLEPHIDPLAVDVRATFDPTRAPEKRWLITSPELAIKRLLATSWRDEGGADRAGAGGAGGARALTRVFQLSHVFRDGERTRRHLPEFTMLEWYRVGAVLDDLVRDHEELVAHVARALAAAGADVAAPATPFARTSVAAAFAAHGFDVRSPSLADDVRARGEPLRAGAAYEAWEDAFFHVMGAHVEPSFTAPTFVERWPASMAVLAQKCADDPAFAERFELYAPTPEGPLEISNAFYELTDPVEQRARFLADNAARVRMGKPALPLDEDFLAALAHLPPTSGCALGFDRLLMWLLGAAAIDDVTALPWR